MSVKIYETWKFGEAFEDKIRKGLIWTAEITLIRGSKRYRFFYDKVSATLFKNRENKKVKNKMKANNGSGNIIERDDWETPKWFFDILKRQYKFTFDCCATKKNTKCKFFTNNFLVEGIGLNLDICWMNPPFSKAEEMFEHFFHRVSNGVCIYRCDNMETKIWQNIILKDADWIFIPKGRLSYEGKEGKGSRFPSALIGVGVKPPMDLIGTTLLINKEDKN